MSDPPSPPPHDLGDKAKHSENFGPESGATHVGPAPNPVTEDYGDSNTAKPGAIPSPDALPDGDTVPPEALVEEDGDPSRGAPGADTPSRPVAPVRPPRPPGRSLVARLWDALPNAVRASLEAQGVLAPAGAHTGVIENPEKSGGMILGPTSAGKTTLIAAMEQACAYRPADDPYDLLWRAGGDEDARDAISDLLRQAVDQVLSPSSLQRATDTVKRYSFAIEGKRAVRGWHSQSVFNLELGFHDAPGGALFARDDAEWVEKSPQRTQVVDDTRGAGMLVLCFDASTRDLPLVSKRLPQVLGLIAGESAVHDGRRFVRERRLDARRVLVLLNKIDVLCQRFANEAARMSSLDDGTAPPTARELAERIDPVAQAIEAIGTPSLRRIRAAMRPEATLAVGICSTWGFHQDGHALFNERGEPIIVERVSPNIFLSQWRPYGVREALLFLASGRASRTVRIVEPEDLEDRLIPESDMGA